MTTGEVFVCSTCGRADLQPAGGWDPPICDECDAAIDFDAFGEAGTFDDTQDTDDTNDANPRWTQIALATLSPSRTASSTVRGARQSPIP